MKHLIFGIFSAIAAITALPLFADSELALKPAFVFEIDKALLARCSHDYDVNTALVAASLSNNDEIAERDVYRALKTCEAKLTYPKQRAYTFVAVEAMEYAGCTASTCTSEQVRSLAETTYSTSSRFKMEYAKSLLVSLRDACSKTHDFECVNTAIEQANERIDRRKFEWLNVDAQGRSRTDAVVEKNDVIENEELFSSILTLKDAVSSAFPEGFDETMEITGPVSSELSDWEGDQDGISVPGLTDQVSIWAKGQLWKVLFSGARSDCVWAIYNQDEIGAVEVTANNRLISSIADARNVCAADTKNMISIAFD